MRVPYLTQAYDSVRVAQISFLAKTERPEYYSGALPEHRR